MKRKLLLITCVLLAIGLPLWFSLSGSKQLFHYLKLSQKAPAAIEKWVIVEKGKDKYAVNAFFSFVFNQSSYKGKGEAGRLYLNPWAAEFALKHFSQQEHTVWFDPKEPSGAVLEKKFPLRGVISSVVAILSGLYVLVLIWLGVRNESKERF